MSIISGKNLKPHTKAFIIVAVTVAAFLLPAFLSHSTSATPTAVDNLGLLQLGTAAGGAHIQSCTGDSCGTGLAWGQIFNAAGATVTLGPNGVAATFIAENPNVPDFSTFFSTSNKNSFAISTTDPCFIGGTCSGPLVWGTGSVPAKDILTNVYSYGATNPANGHLIIYTGFERIAPNGDSHIDVEFYQSQVRLDQASGQCPKASTPCSFVGQHTPGDVIVSMDFLVGGSLGSFSARTWTGSSYNLLVNATGEGCAGSGSICAFNNGASIPSGNWTTYGKLGAVVTSLLPNAFTNFGIDVTALLGATPCFSTEIGKTRSSGSFTAELKDFAGPTGFGICSAHIKIAPSAINEVGVRHTFTVTFTESVGLATSPVPDNTKVIVTLAAANGAVISNPSDNCASPGTVNGICTVSFTSFTAGTVTGVAKGTVLIGGTPFTATTDGSTGNSAPAVKRFVDAFVTIGPNGVNSINEPHTFTATVKVIDGFGGPAVNAADGTPVSITLVPVSPLTSGDITTLSNSCITNPGTVSGSCSITFTSDKAGQVNGAATATPTVSGVTMTRTTNGVGQNSLPAMKLFVSGSIAWTKVDNAGNLLGGATFQYCRTQDLVNGVLVPTPGGPICNSVTDNNPPDQNSIAGQFLVTGLQLGTYTIHETVAPPGFEVDPRTATVTITIASPNANITTTPFGAFVDQRSILKLTQFGYTNTPTGTPTAGVVSGTTVYSIQFTNYGAATASLSATLAVSVTGQGSGTLTCTSGCTQTFTATLAPGASTMFTLTINYSNMANLAVISAQLTASYTTNGLTRTPSGTPATISFTIQSS